MRPKPQIMVVLLLCILALFFVFFVIPMINGVFISFTDWNGLSSEYNFVGLENFMRMFNDTRFLDSIKVTLNYAGVLLFFSLFLGYVNARTIFSLRKTKSGVLFISFFPYVITPVVVSILWNQLFIGLIPAIGDKFNIGFLQINLLANKSTAIYSIAFVDLWMLVPYSMLLFLSSLSSIPREIIEHARVEGANSLQITKYIELPFMIPTIGLIVTVIMSYALTHIDTIMTLTAGGPGRVTETLYYTIYKNSTLEQRYAYGLAEGIIVTIISIFFFLIVNKITNNKNLEDITSE